MGVKHTTIQQSLAYVSNNPVPKTDDLLSLPAHELIARTLFEIANGAQLNDKRSMAMANTARNVIFQRLVGRRKAGSHPATRSEHRVLFKNMTGEISE